MRKETPQIKHKDWKKLIEKKLGIKSPKDKNYEIDKLVRFVELLHEVELENIKMKNK